MTVPPYDNECSIYFDCHAMKEKECMCYIHDLTKDRCRYQSTNFKCHNPIAQRIAMIDELKRRGVRI
jgi:hypothetical protein